jgi:hypothetical protein
MVIQGGWKLTPYYYIVNCYVTNNNWFRTGWLDLLTPSCTVSLNHNRLELITISLQLKPSSLMIENQLHSSSRSGLVLFCTACIVSRMIHRKHHFLCSEDILTVQFLRNKSPIILRIFFCENILATRCLTWYEHIESCNSFSIVAWAYFGRCLYMGLHVTIYYNKILHIYIRKQLQKLNWFSVGWLAKLWYVITLCKLVLNKVKLMN